MRNILIQQLVSCCKYNEAPCEGLFSAHKKREKKDLIADMVL